MSGHKPTKAWVSEEQVRRAREVDLLSYLQNHEPDNLRQVGGEYCLRDHDSLRISNGKWNWHSQDIGGKSALDYLIKVRGMGFVQAVEALCNSRVASLPAAPVPASPPVQRREFRLPPKSSSNYRVTAYLQSRGIGKALIDRCIRAGILYESTPYHNAVFVGKDSAGQPRFACARGTLGNFKGDVAGSDKRFGFCLPPVSPENGGSLAVFESPIDALSHAELTGTDCHRLSLAGTAPTALIQFLQQHPEIAEVTLCLDNDIPGLVAMEAIECLQWENHRFASVAITRSPPPSGKDYNEALLNSQRRKNTPEQDRHHDGGPAL